MAVINSLCPGVRVKAWRLKSAATPMFVQQMFRVDTKGPSLVNRFEGNHRWIPLTKGQ